jgi:hypothetical protein
MVNVINEIVTQLRTITELKLVTIWNNQFNYMDDGEIYSFPFPCAFVEISAEGFEQLGNNYQATDIVVKVHIGNDFYNGSNIDENLTIFVLRDLVVKKLSRFKPTTAGDLVKKSEKQDFQHSNVYHYEIDFITHYVDTTNATIDTIKAPPTALQINK